MSRVEATESAHTTRIVSDGADASLFTPSTCANVLLSAPTATLVGEWTVRLYLSLLLCPLRHAVCCALCLTRAQLTKAAIAVEWTIALEPAALPSEGGQTRLLRLGRDGTEVSLWLVFFFIRG